MIRTDSKIGLLLSILSIVSNPWTVYCRSTQWKAIFVVSTEMTHQRSSPLPVFMHNIGRGLMFFSYSWLFPPFLLISALFEISPQQGFGKGKLYQHTHFPPQGIGCILVWVSFTTGWGNVPQEGLEYSAIYSQFENHAETEEGWGRRIKSFKWNHQQSTRCSSSWNATT